MPDRIQLSRRKGWRLPPGAVSVARPTILGNPFDWQAAQRAGYGDGRGAAVDAFRSWLVGAGWGAPFGCAAADNLAPRRQAILDRLPDLRGRDLACWCALDCPCHADVLLALANADS